MLASFLVGDLVVGAGSGLGLGLDFGLGLTFCCLGLRCVSSMYAAVLVGFRSSYRISKGGWQCDEQSCQCGAVEELHVEDENRWALSENR